MTARSSGPTACHDDLAEAPFLDDAERAEAQWLRAKDGDPAAPAPSPTIARQYAEIEELLGSLPMAGTSDRWRDDVLQRAAEMTAARARTRRWAAVWAAGGALATAGALFVLLRPSRELEVSIRDAHATRDSGTHAGDRRSAAVGDQLVVHARPKQVADLRVFRDDGKLVARCPGGQGCSSTTDAEYLLTVRLDAPMRYHVILVVGTRDLPIDATMNEYASAARVANARVVTEDPIEVH
jgi:hypothetical protein